MGMFLSVDLIVHAMPKSIVLGRRASRMRTRAGGSNKRWIAFAGTMAMDQVGDSWRRAQARALRRHFRVLPSNKGIDPASFADSVIVRLDFKKRMLNG
jgi:hypothetical protein